MATIYEAAGPTVKKVLEEAMHKWHDDLEAAGVSVDLLFALNDGEGPAVKVHGYKCAAEVRVVNYRDRVKGGADAEITIDKEWWMDHDDAEKLALLDHELTHLELKIDEETRKPKMDLLDRPKLSLRLHDVHIGIFTECAKRHGAAAPDTQIVVEFVTGPDGQMIMQFAEELQPA